MPTDPTAAVAESLNTDIDWSAVGGFVETYGAELVAGSTGEASSEKGSVQVTLSERVADQLRNLGGGSITQGIRQLLDQRSEA